MARITRSKDGHKRILFSVRGHGENPLEREGIECYEMLRRMEPDITDRELFAHAMIELRKSADEGWVPSTSPDAVTQKTLAMLRQFGELAESIEDALKNGVQVSTQDVSDSMNKIKGQFADLAGGVVSFNEDDEDWE